MNHRLIGSLALALVPLAALACINTLDGLPPEETPGASGMSPTTSGGASGVSSVGGTTTASGGASGSASSTFGGTNSGATSTGGVATTGGTGFGGITSTGGVTGTGGTSFGGFSAAAGSGVGAGSGLGGGSGSASAGRGGSAGTTSVSAPTFASVRTLITQACAEATCHGGRRNPNLGTASLYTTLTTTTVRECGSDRLVTPRDPANSAILELVQGQCGELWMPEGCDTLPCIDAESIKLLTDWINAGAPQQ